MAAHRHQAADAGDGAQVQAQQLDAGVPAALPPRAHAFNEDADLSLFGALVIRGQFLKSTDKSLALEDLIARNPQILQEQIRRPLFVLGLARTGTTLMQRLLSLHSDARYLPFWEGYTPDPRELGNHKGGQDGRYREAKNRLKMLNWVGPEFNKIHPIEIDDPKERYHLFRNHFLVPPGFDFANVPSFWESGDARATPTPIACTSASCRRCNGSIRVSIGC